MNSRSVLLVIIVGVATSVIIEIVCEKPILTSKSASELSRERGREERGR